MSDSPKPAGTIMITLPPEEETGQRIGRYKLLQKLGEGGCGVVFMSEQEEPVKRRVALKVIKLGMDTHQVVARFEAERQALAMMDHPNIAKALDAGTTDNGRPFFVMELVRGVKITEYCDQNKLSAEDRLQLFTQVCSAIQHAHQKGIIHRDIKPSNILVTLHDGVPVPKVIDFGIAKATQQQLTDKTLFTEIQQFIGTPAYMSPEQAELSGLDIDTRSDIYSLGVLLYELLTGRTPFDPKELVKAGLDELRRKIREDEPLRPSTRVSTLADAELTDVANRRHLQAPQLVGLLRGDLDWIVMKCLEKDRTRRYETANGLAMDIKRYLSHEPVAARPPSAAYRIQKFSRRHRVGLAAAAGVVVAVLLGLGFSTWSFIQERKARSRAEAAEQQQALLRGQAETAQAQAVQQKQIAEEQKSKAEESALQAQRSLYAADMNLIQTALKANNLGRARRLLDRHRPTGTNDLRGWEWRYLWQQCQSDALFTLTNRPARAMSVDFSRDGALVAVGFLDGWIGVWNMAQRRLVASITNAGAGFLAFSPVEPLLICGAPPDSARLINLETMEERKLPLDVQRVNVPGVAFSKDGTKVAALCAHENRGRVRVWDVKTGALLQTISAPMRGAVHQGRLRFSADGEALFVGGIGKFFEARRVSDGAEIWRAKGGDDLGLTAVAISPDGNFLATGFGYAEDTVRIWDTNGQTVATLQGHSSWTGDLDFSPDGKRLLSAAADQTLRIWDTTEWKEIAVLRGHGDEVHSGAFSPDGQFIVSGAKDGAVLVWSASPSLTRVSPFIFPSETTGVNLLSRSQNALAINSGKPPAIWNLATRQAAPLPLSTNGSYGFEDGAMVHYDREKWLTIHRFTNGAPREIDRIDVGPDLGGVAYWPQTGALALGYGSNRIDITSLNSTDRRRSIPLNSDQPIIPWRFFDGAQRLMGVTQGGELSIWNIASAQRMPGFESIYIAALRGLTAAHDTRFIFAGVDAKQNPPRVQFFYCDFSNANNPITRTEPGLESINSLALSPNGKLLAAGSATGRAMLYNAANGEVIHTLHGHLNSASGVKFSPDGSRLATGSGSHEAVKLWDVASGHEVLNLEGQGSLLGSVDFSDDGNTIIAGSRERNRHWLMWRAPSWEEINAAEKN